MNGVFLQSSCLTGPTKDFYFSVKSSHNAAKKVFEKALNFSFERNPRATNVDKNSAHSFTLPKVVKKAKRLSRY